MASFNHTPPPFFKRGPAPLALLTLYVALSLALFVVDLKMRSLDLIRQSIAVLVDPVQRVAQVPGSLVDVAQDYLDGIGTLREENARLRHDRLETAPGLERLAQLEAENARLRRLLNVEERETAHGQVARILYSARDPFARKIIIDRGQQANVVPGLPVIDDTGIVGQVTRSFPFSAEITLITDKDQVVPVQVVRNGQRSVIFGLGNGQMELRYMPANADVAIGDELVTSGLDGVYLPGFPVAKVVNIERDSAYSFARIFCAPVAGVENFGEVIVLNARAPQQEQPPDSASRGTGEERVSLRPRKKRGTAR